MAKGLDYDAEMRKDLKLLEKAAAGWNHQHKKAVKTNIRRKFTCKEDGSCRNRTPVHCEDDFSGGFLQ